MSKLSQASHFPTQKGSLQSSEHVTWNTLDSLGRGATAVVYMGRIQDTGQVVAVKAFHDHVHLHPGEKQTRELELLRRLKHENIISLFSIERETSSRRVVLIMEYCEGGSLYHMLDQPQYSCGFPEVEFLLVLKHVVGGIRYLRETGVIHRDIKPGNIMRYVTEEGQSIYKLTDFGAARELTEQEEFTSLYGTEEYLHPRLYETALLRQTSSQRFTATVDLWSLGVTFFHVATGDLPYKPYDGRGDRVKMFEITTQKRPGVISGVQMSSQGDIIWSKHLPETCPLSSCMKTLLVPLLAGLMEPDEYRALTYPTFFRQVDSILEKVHLTIFSVSSCSVIKICLNEIENYSSIKEHIAASTEIPSSDQLILIDGRHIEDHIDTTANISTYPAHILKNEIFLYRKDLNQHDKEKIQHPKIPQVAGFDNTADMEGDYRLAQRCSSGGHLIKRYTAHTVHVQGLLVQAERCLWKYIVYLLKCSESKYESMSRVATFFKRRLHTFYSLLEMNQSLLNVLQSPVKLFQDVTRDKTVTAVFEKAEERTQEIATYRTALVARLQGNEERVKNRLVPCEETNCLSEVEHRLSSTSAIQNRFRRDKNVRAEMTNHDRDIHRFEKDKMKAQYTALCSIPQGHCFVQLDALHSEYLDIIGGHLKNLTRVSKVNMNIESVVDCFNMLSSKLDKTEIKCKEAFERTMSAVLENQDGHQQFKAPSVSVGEMRVVSPDNGNPKDSGIGQSCNASKEAENVEKSLGNREDSLMSSELRLLKEEGLRVTSMFEENTHLMTKLGQTVVK